MENPEDPQFEQYLKRFRPLAAEPLPAARPRLLRFRPFVVGLSALAAGLIVAALLLHHPAQPPPRPAQATTAALIAALPEVPHPLTLADANALLAQSPSVKTTLNWMAFQHSSLQFFQGQQSALAVLSKENRL
jgi:hypothetical protein